MRRRKLKILIVVWSVFTDDIAGLSNIPSGGNMLIYDIADGVSEFEDVTLFVGKIPMHGKVVRKMQIADTMDLYHQPANLPDFSDAKEMHIERMKYAFEQILRNGNFDLVNLQGGGRFENECIDICARLGVKCILTTHLFIGNNKDFDKYEEDVCEEQKLFRKPGVLVSAVSNGQRKKILAEYPKLSPEQIIAIPNGISMINIEHDWDEETREIRKSIRQFAAGRRILVCSGTIKGRKNQLQLVRAWRYLPPEIKNDIAIAFFGADRLEGKLQEEIKKEGGEQSMRYFGLFTPVQSGGAYALSSGIISVSRAEGLSLVLLEGMSCGKPVILFRDSECADDLADAQVATFIEARREEAIAAAIAKWYNAAWDSKYIRGYTEQHFARDKMIRQYVEMFHKVAGAS